MNDSASRRLAFEFTFGTSPRATVLTPDAPRRFLLIGDFSGRNARGICEPLASRKPVAVDADTLGASLARCSASLDLPAATSGAKPILVQFETLEDFHPDSLLQRLPPLAELMAARRDLESPGLAATASEKVAQLLRSPASQPAPSAPVPDADSSGESADATLARLLGKSPAAQTQKPSGPQGIESLIKDIVASSGSVTPAQPAEVAASKSAVELELAVRLRAVLHHSSFQAMEAAWRSVDFMVRRCPDEERIKLSLLDASLAELGSDLMGLDRALRDQHWTAIVGLFQFGDTQRDLETLAGLARVCATHRCGFLAGAHPQLVSCDSLARHPDPDDWQTSPPEAFIGAWKRLRESPEAVHVGLALPRFLLRQPYGAASDPIQSFAFEEVPDAAEHESFLWGNSAVLCAQLLSEALAQEEDSDRSWPAGVGELPVFSFAKDGERANLPCAEVWLTDRAAETILNRGLIPVLSIRGRDAVHVLPPRSIAHPPRPLVLGR